MYKLFTATVLMHGERINQSNKASMSSVSHTYIHYKLRTVQNVVAECLRNREHGLDLSNP